MSGSPVFWWTEFSLLLPLGAAFVLANGGRLPGASRKGRHEWFRITTANKVERLGHERPSLAAMQAAVGGWIEATPLPEGWRAFEMYGNEEGRLVAEPQVNRLATQLVALSYAGLGDVYDIVGDVVVRVPPGVKP